MSVRAGSRGRARGVERRVAPPASGTPAGPRRAAAAGVELHLPPRIEIAAGAFGRLAEVARACSIERALIVSDPFMREHGPVDAAMRQLAAAGVLSEVYAGVQPDPTIGNVEAGLEALRAHRADGVVAIGGGSAIDAGKAIAAMARNEGSIADYAGYHRIPRPGLPLVAVPTTAGTGSEVTRVAVITDTERELKMMLLDGHLMCAAALVDYELTLSCPPELTAHVGVDSLTHAIESYVSTRASALTDMWALAAARLIATHLREAVSQPDSVPARSAMALAATLAGMAFSNASVALVHGMSRPLGARFHLAHGLSNAVLLPAVTRYSIPGAPSRYADLAREMGLADERMPQARAAELLAEGLQQLNVDLGIPRLRELGVDHARLQAVKAEMARAALDSGSPGFNPRVPSATEIEEIYEGAL